MSGFELRPTPPGAQVFNRFGRERREFADSYSENVVGQWSPRVIVCTGPIGYDDTSAARHAHEWKVWRNGRLADGKILIPRVISHSTPVVEHPELVAKRALRATG